MAALFIVEAELDALGAGLDEVEVFGLEVHCVGGHEIIIAQVRSLVV